MKKLFNFEFWQKFGKALMVVVAVMPAAGLMISIGKTIPLINQDLGFLVTTGSVVESIGWAIIGNLHLLFALAIGGSWAKDKAGGAFAAGISFVLINRITGALFGVTSDMLANEEAYTHTLFGTKIMVKGFFTSVLEAPALNMGVFVGIIAGFVGAMAFNKYYNYRKLPEALSFFNGKRFVPFVVILWSVMVSLGLAIIWPVIQSGINNFGLWIAQSQDSAPILAPFLYGTLERLLIPTGLHHLVYTPFLYTSLGGIQEVGGQIFEGARNIYFAEIADPSVSVLSPSVIWDARGISKMFGLIGACLAMYHTASPENKNKAKAILIPAVVTSFVAGVTEPIEFSFMFVAPLLFIVHAALSGLSMVMLNLLSVRAIGPNGFIDFLLYNVPLGIEKTGWPMYILVGLVFFAIYYVTFRFLITKFKFKTIGREDTGQETKLYSKKEYNESKAAKPASGGAENQGDTGLASTIVAALGGPDNIDTVTNCYTRLRLTLHNPGIVDEQSLKNDTGASGVIIKDHNVHVVYGLQVSSVRKAVDHYLGRESEE